MSAICGVCGSSSPSPRSGRFLSPPFDPFLAGLDAESAVWVCSASCLRAVSAFVAPAPPAVRLAPASRGFADLPACRAS